MHSNNGNSGNQKNGGNGNRNIGNDAGHSDNRSNRDDGNRNNQGIGGESIHETIAGLIDIIANGECERRRITLAVHNAISEFADEGERRHQALQVLADQLDIGQPFNDIYQSRPGLTFSEAVTAFIRLVEAVSLDQPDQDLAQYIIRDLREKRWTDRQFVAHMAGRLDGARELIDEDAELFRDLLDTELSQNELRNRIALRLRAHDQYQRQHLLDTITHDMLMDLQVLGNEDIDSEVGDEEFEVHNGNRIEDVEHEVEENDDSNGTALENVSNWNVGNEASDDVLSRTEAIRDEVEDEGDSNGTALENFSDAEENSEEEEEEEADVYADELNRMIENNLRNANVGDETVAENSGNAEQNSNEDEEARSGVHNRFQSMRLGNTEEESQDESADESHVVESDYESESDDEDDEVGSEEDFDDDEDEDDSDYEYVKDSDDE